MKHLLLKTWLLMLCLLTLGGGNYAWAETKTGSWDLTSASTDWTASGNETYFSQPYGYKKADGTLTIKSISDFSTSGITQIKVGFKCLQNGATTSKLTIYLIDKDGKTLGSGVVVTPDNKSAASQTTYKYATFTTNLTGATGFMMKVTTFGKNILINGAEYEVTYTSAGGGDPSGDEYTHDVLTNADLAATGTTYTAFSNVSKNTAVYAGQSSKNNGIQLRATSPSGIVSTTSGGKIKNVTVTWNSNTTSDRTIDVYGSNTAYTSAADLYNSTSQGTKLGSIVMGTSTSVTVTGDYDYVGIRSNSGSLNIDKIDFAWEPAEQKYDVTFNLQGHGEAVESQSIAEGEKVTEPTAPTATGYTFGGWYKEAECTNAWNFSTDVMGTSAVTLYAKWTANNYTITYNNVEGATHSNPTSYTIEAATINLADASKDGYIFLGWFDNEGLTGDAVTTIAQGSTGDKAFWAKWIEVPANPSVVTFNVGEHGTCEKPSATEETVGAGVALPNVTANEGWVFKGWSTENPATAETIVSAGDDGMYHIVANTTLYAYYKVKPATPTFSPEAGEIEKGTEVTISCTTENATIYYTTNGDDPTAESATYSEAIAVNAEQTIKAIAILDGEESEVASAEYTIAQHTAHFSINGVITAGNNCIVAKGEAITFPADPSAPEEHVFIGWKKGGDEVTTPQDETIATVDKATEVMGAEDVTYYAVWAVGSGSGGWTRVTKASQITAGKKIIIGYEADHANAKGTIVPARNEKPESATYLYTGTTVGSSTTGTITISSLSDNDAQSYIYIVEAGHTDNTFALKNAANTYIGHNGRNVVKFYDEVDSDGKTDFSFSVGDNDAVTVTNYYGANNTTTYNKGEHNYKYLRYNTAANQQRFSIYESGQTDPVIYILVGSSYSDYSTKVVVREISNITVKTAPTTVNYYEGENFDPAGLEITVNYTEGDPEDVTYTGNEAKFSFSPALAAELTDDNDQVTITYKGKSCQQTINVRTVSINAPVAEGGSYTVKVGDAEAVTADGNTINALKGQKVVLASTPADGYKVASTPFVVTDEDENEVSVSSAGGQYSFTMPGKNVTITAQFSRVYTITAGSCEHGSITAIKDKDDAEITEISYRSKVVVEATADAHYHLSGMYYVKENEETQNTITGNEGVYSFTMPQSNVTVYAEFEEDDNVTITWSINGNTDRKSKVYVDEAIEFPTDVADIEDKVFCGWVGENNKNYTSNNVAPTYANADEVIASEDVTYYAVFATVSEGEDFELVENLANINEGEAYIGSYINYGGSRYYVATSATDLVSATVTNKVLTIPTNAIKLTFVATGTANEFYIKNEDDAYLNVTSSDWASFTSTACALTFSGSSPYTLKTSTGNNYLRAYGSSATAGKLKRYASQTNTGICVFQKSKEYSDYCTKVKTTPTLSFAEPTYNALMGGDFTAPELTNPQNVTVTYSSSVEAVATVDSETGAITLVAPGTTTITASFDGTQDENYMSISASYTLVVAPRTFDLSVSSVGYATLCLPYNATVPQDATVYTGTYNNGVVTLNKVEGGKIKAGEGYIVKAPAATYTFTITSDEVEAPENNHLKGVTDRTPLTGDGSIYIFANQTQGVGFYKLGGDKTAYLAANKAYLQLPAGGGVNAREFVGFGDDTETGIDAVDALPMTDGKYLKDGKIVIVKNGVKYNVNGQRTR